MLGQTLSAFLGEESPKLIKINLATLTLSAFENDQLIKKYELAGTGNPKNSPTPQGDFRIFQKKEKVLSSLSHVWMPWSLRFYKGYYIHGVPYFPSGQLVKSRYSLGCIRLLTTDAQDLYQWASLGTKVEIYSEVKLIKKEGDGNYKVYRVDDNVKQWIKTPAAFERLGYSWQQIDQVNAQEFDAYQLGAEIE